MSAFTKKFGKFIPGTAILLAHALFILVTSLGEFSGPRIAAGKPWVHAIAVFFMLVTVIYGYKYPFDAPQLKNGGVNAPTILGIIILAVGFVLGWILFYWGGTYVY